MNRIESLIPGSHDRSPDYNMRMLMETITPSVIVPQLSKYYVFVYNAKTRNIRYDQNPFIMCTGVHRWGFSGYNYHWNSQRNYSWNEVVTNLYEIEEDEAETMLSYPTAHFRTS